MTAHSLKTIKVKRKTKFVGSRQDDRSHIGFTDAEARGIFGCKYEFTDEEKAYIEKVKKMRAKYYTERQNQSPIRKIERSEYSETKARERKQAIDQKCAEFADSSESKSFAESLKVKHDELKELGLNLVGFRKADGEITYL